MSVRHLNVLGRRHALLSVFVAMLLLPRVSQAQSGERLSDNDVKTLLGEIDQARDRFEDQLDGNLKASVLRTPTGEVNVSRYLDDLQENVKNLKDRFNRQYSASKEAETVLRQGTEIHTYIKAKPAEIKGGSEWDTMTRGLTRLAQAYNTSFPLPNGATVRRMNDLEVSSTADTFAKGADELKKQIGKESTVDKAVRDTVVKDVDAVAKQARVVKSRASESKPATSEMRQLVELTSKVDGFIRGQSRLSAATSTAWNALSAPMGALQQAYGLGR